jgi:general nucleoside transport system ATP-binding protein
MPGEVPPSAGDPPALEARGISRRFGTVQALTNVDFTLRTGEIHALVGENGAGKSTLAKIVAGVLRADRGEMHLFGEPYAPASRRDGAGHGVAHVRQQLSLVRGLTVAENLQLGRPDARALFDARAARAEVTRMSDELGLSVPPDTLVDDLPLAVRQQAEILIGVAWGARVLILDEPSSALGPVETEALIRLCQRLRGEGTPIIYISHRLPELVELADRLTILRQGRVVLAGEDVRAADLARIAELMIGDLSLLRVERPQTVKGAVRLAADGLSVGVDHGVGLDAVSLSVHGGEIVGVVGVAGNGQEALAEVLTGVRRPEHGTVVVDGVEVTGSSRKAIDAGMAHLHEDRATGLAHQFTLADNAIVRRIGDSAFARLGLRRRRPVGAHVAALATQFEVRPPIPGAIAGALSGGNQQKLMAARELERDPAVLVAAGPTKGLDPHAARAMRDRCFGVAERGGAVVVISADLDEVRDLAHRVVVLSGGRVTDEFPIEEMTSARLGAAMAGLEPVAVAAAGPEPAGSTSGSTSGTTAGDRSDHG